MSPFLSMYILKDGADKYLKHVHVKVFSLKVFVGEDEKSIVSLSDVSVNLFGMPFLGFSFIIVLLINLFHLSSFRPLCTLNEATNV